MPRKRTIQPAPLQSFTLPDGTLVEVRDESTWEIGRGQHKVLDFLNRRDEILQRVCSDYLSPSGCKRVSPDKDYLANATKFARKVQLWGLHTNIEVDDSATRKNMYRDIVLNINALKSALIDTLQ